MATLPRERRAPALELVERLLAERVLAPADVLAAHVPARRALGLEGEGPVREALDGFGANKFRSIEPDCKTGARRDA